MATIKISELPLFSNLSSNPANTTFVAVDNGTRTTGQLSADTLAHNLFANNILNVGITGDALLPNTLAQFISYIPVYSQVNFQNQLANGSMDIVITSANGDNANNYLDIGVQGPAMAPDSNFSIASNNDAYIFYNGASGVPGGNLFVGTGRTGDDLVFFTGGLHANNEIGRFKDGTGLILKTKPLTFADGTSQNTAAISSAYSVSASGVANAALAHSVSAFSTANSALANVSGAYFGGTLNIKDQLNVNGVVTISNSTFGNTTAAFKINGANGASQVPINDGYMLHVTGKPNVSSRIIVDAFGINGNAYALLAGRTARGTPTSPQAVANGDVLFRLSGNGYGSTQYSPLGVARIDIIAGQDFTDSTRGSTIQFWNMPLNSNTLTRIATFNAEYASFTGLVSPEKGFIYVPRIFSGAQTAITIDFANNSVIKANTTAGVTVSFSNYIAGKVVDVWLTNTSGGTQTITHGCTAQNSTKNLTTFSLPGTCTAYMKYYCVGGDSANVFVAIVQG